MKTPLNPVEPDGEEGGGQCSPPIDGEVLLNRMLEFLLRFVRLPSDEHGYAAVLWAAHTHLMEAWDTTPRLAFLSAEPGSGKSRAMEITALFCPLALEAANATTPSLIRALDDPAGRPCFFIDEIDTKYGPKAKGDEELRGMINAGHRRGGIFLKCELVDDRWVPVAKESFAAVGMAGIGNLPDTILTRSVIVKMTKRAPHERVEPYRQRDHKQTGHALRDELAEWADQVREDAAKCRPNLPTTVVDRNADVWEPLIVVADLAGGVWPARARAAAEKFVAASKEEPPPSLGLRLLMDIRNCFGSAAQLTTEELIRRLLADQEAPWGELPGGKLTPMKLADFLRPYGIRSGTVRVSASSTPKGYKRVSFEDAWLRQLPTLENSATRATPATSTDGRGDGQSEANDI